MITRRHFIAGTSAIALAAALAPMMSAGEAWAQQAATAVPMVELMAPGALADHVLGKDDAPVTVVEYASMTCSHCATFHTRTYPELKKRYIETGKVKYILREFPIDPLAAGAFMLARCAGKDKYYPLVETLFTQQSQWVTQKPIEPLMAIARQAGFTQQTFDACLKDQKMLEGIEAIRNRGADKFGVSSTPTFFINGKKFTGVMSIEDMAKEIDPLIKS